MKRWLRMQSWIEYLRGTLWFVPSLTVLGAVALGAVLSRVQVRSDGFGSSFIFQGGTDGARAMLQAIAGSVVTVTGLTFSLTLVTLQLASSQFSPRLLRTFLRDPVTQIVLGILLGTFAYSITVLRRIRSSVPGTPSYVPDLAITVGFLWALASVAAVVWYLSHVTRELRVDRLMQDVEDETLSTIGAMYDAAGLGPGEDEVTDPPDTATELRAQTSGFVQALDQSSLVKLATRHDLVIQLAMHPGSHLVEGDPVGCWWPARLPGRRPDAAEIERRVARAVTVGFERTAQQDVAYGLRQLVDIAARGLSPGVNDPTTAVHALNHLAVLLRRLATRHLAPLVNRDDEGRARVIMTRPTFADYLDLTCGQIRRYGASEPDVVIRLVQVLGATLRHTPDPERKRLLCHEMDLAFEAARRQIDDPADLERVAGAVQQARAQASSRGGETAA